MCPAVKKQEKKEEMNEANPEKFMQTELERKKSFKKNRENELIGEYLSFSKDSISCILA